MSLLNCLCAAIPARERVISVEEVFELPKAVLLHMCAPRSHPGTPQTAENRLDQTSQPCGRGESNTRQAHIGQAWPVRQYGL